MGKYKFIKSETPTNYTHIEGEIWRPAIGHEYCEVSNYGRVMMLYRERIRLDGFIVRYNPCILKPAIIKGYCKVCLSVVNASTGKRVNKQFSVHRLIAMAFIPNILEKEQVNHKDGDKQNNKVENLEWCTPKENMTHAVRTGLKVEKKGQFAHNSKLTDIQINEIRKLSKTERHADIAKKFGIHKSQISSIATGRTWSHIPIADF